MASEKRPYYGIRGEAGRAAKKEGRRERSFCASGIDHSATFYPPLLTDTLYYIIACNQTKFFAISGANVPLVKIGKKFVTQANVERAAKIFEEHAVFIRAVIRTQVKNPSQADDLFQDLFLSLVSKPVPDEIRNIKSYLYKAIINDIIDASRRVQKYQSRVQKYAHALNYTINKNRPQNAFIETEEAKKMFKLIEGLLPPSEARAIALRYKDNCDIKEVAKKMQVNNRSVSRYISVRLSKLRKVFTA
ncbi:MAG: RNA polymerase sigma factor [Planctomycetota bacterium]